MTLISATGAPDARCQLTPSSQSPDDFIALCHAFQPHRTPFDIVASTLPPATGLAATQNFCFDTTYLYATLYTCYLRCMLFESLIILCLPSPSLYYLILLMLF
jgi:hypothetical protein